MKRVVPSPPLERGGNVRKPEYPVSITASISRVRPDGSRIGSLNTASKAAFTTPSITPLSAETPLQSSGEPGIRLALARCLWLPASAPEAAPPRPPRPAQHWHHPKPNSRCPRLSPLFFLRGLFPPCDGCHARRFLSPGGPFRRDHDEALHEIFVSSVRLRSSVLHPPLLQIPLPAFLALDSTTQKEHPSN